MVAVAKGIIVATTLLLAAGLAAYENENLRAWIETQRRKIAIALTGNDGVSSEDEKERERHAEGLAIELRDEVIRRHREEIIERARKEGVAVDLDELNAVEKMYEEERERADAAAAAGKGHERRRSAQSFDELVGSDGMLRDRDITAGFSSGVASSAAPRQRGLRGFGFGAAFANPFDDEAGAFYDQELIGAGGEELVGLARSEGTSRTISQEPDLSSLVDVHESPYKSDEELNDEINEAIRRSLEDVDTQQQPLVDLDQDHDIKSETSHHAEDTMSQPISQAPSMQNSIYQSYYYGAGPSHPSTEPSTLENSTASFRSAYAAFESPDMSTTFQVPSPATLLADEPSSRHVTEEAEDSDDNLTPAGTLTPTTEAGFSADEDSLYGEPSVDFNELLGQRLHDHRGQSAARDATATHIDDEEDSDDFSVVEGANTPGSWTDVESVGGYDDEVEEVDEQEEERRRREASSSTVR